MEPKEKVFALIELCKIQMDHFEKTRNIEFKVNIALWTLIALAGKFVYDENDLHKGGFFIIGYVVFAIVITWFHCLWMSLIQRSEDRDHESNNEYKTEILQIFSNETRNNQLLRLKPKEEKCLCCQFKDLRKHPPSLWVFCEVGITVVLLVGLGFILCG